MVRSGAIPIRIPVWDSDPNIWALTDFEIDTKLFFKAFGFGGFNQMMLKAQKAQKQAFDGDSSDRQRRAYPVLEKFEPSW